MKAPSRPIGPIVTLLVVIVAGIYPATARSAGISLYETGAPDLGTAGAGRAAMAADALNSGHQTRRDMTLLDRSQLLVAAGAMLPAINFHVAPYTTTAGNGGPAAGRQACRAFCADTSGQAFTHVGEDFGDAISRHDRDAGKRDPRHQKSFAHHHRRNRDSARDCARRDHRAGRTLRRLESLREGWELKYCYNWLDRERYTLESKEALPAGKVTVKFEFNYDGGGVGKGGTGQLLVNGQKVVDGRIERTQPFIFSADETEDVGEDLGTPVSEDYKEGDNKFTGTIDKVTIAVTPPPAQVQKEEERQDAVIDEGIN